MPIYEYRCSDCGFKDEFLQKASEAPLTVCPSCGKSAFTKQLSAAGFQLKGSGWYATDFRNSGAKPAKGGEAKAEGDTEAKAERKAEGKAEAKSQGKAEAKPEGKADGKPAGASKAKATAPE